MTPKKLVTGKMETTDVMGHEPQNADIYFNGRFIGQTKDAVGLVTDIRKKRRMNLIPNELNIAHYPHFQEVRVSTEQGRARRPLLIVENGKLKITETQLKNLKEGKITWKYLIEHGIIEYLDTKEEENAYVAINEESLTKSHTHMEVNPIAMLGISASIIPYPEYNRGDRINYGAKMIGQSVGIPCSNFLVRTDTKFNVMVYPQKSLIKTHMTRLVDRYPEGQNVVVAIMSYEGYNMNDAIILNQSSVERGLFRSYYFRTHEALKKRYWGGQEDMIEIPEPGIKGHRGEGAYANLDEDGIINPETPVESESVLLGKVSPLRFLSSEEFASDIENKRETSVVVRHGERGIIDKVIITETPDSNQLFKIRMRDLRIPEIGDKFATRHGQKGVVGLVVPQHDMPFTSDGVVPDVIFNPHAIPSRMTIGQLLELLGGKTSALSGQTIDASAFDHMKDQDVRSILNKMGFNDDGKQILYDGKSGKMYEARIYVGISYYLKLDHMVSDKIHARSRGPVTLLTKQPTEGRAKRGGLRIGEMEQQCIVGHGAALTLKERFDSDKTTLPVCKKCGLIATQDLTRGKISCSVCKDSEITWIETSYAFKLTLDEMKAMGIYPKIVTEEI